MGTIMINNNSNNNNNNNNNKNKTDSCSLNYYGSINRIILFLIFDAKVLLFNVWGFFLTRKTTTTKQNGLCS